MYDSETLLVVLNVGFKSVALIVLAVGLAASAQNTRRIPIPTPGKITVLIFVRTDCPVSNRYAPEIQRLSNAYAPRVSFWLVYPDSQETADSIRDHALRFGRLTRTIQDPKHELVKMSEAKITPEAAVFSRSGALLYHGRIDDRYVDFGKSRPEPSQHDLEDILNAALAGKPVPKRSAPAVGCYISDLQ